MKIRELQEGLAEICVTYDDSMEVAVNFVDEDGDMCHCVITGIRVSSEPNSATKRVVLS